MVQYLLSIGGKNPLIYGPVHTSIFPSIEFSVRQSITLKMHTPWKVGYIFGYNLFFHVCSSLYGFVLVDKIVNMNTLM